MLWVKNASMTGAIYVYIVEIVTDNLNAFSAEH